MSAVPSVRSTRSPLRGTRRLPRRRTTTRLPRPRRPTSAGLTARADGFTLALADRTLPAGRTRLDFTILTSSGRPLLDYTREHEKDLHLIVVRRDLTGFQHVHPRLDPATGTWSTDVDLTPGTWRVIADFTPEGWEGITLADDVSVAGDFRPRGPAGRHPHDDRGRRPRAPTRSRLEGDTAPGAGTVLTTRIELDGEPVTDLEPYLGAFGHLVAIRAGDLGYLHVHPEEGEPGPSSRLRDRLPHARGPTGSSSTSSTAASSAPLPSPSSRAGPRACGEEGDGHGH